MMISMTAAALASETMFLLREVFYTFSYFGRVRAPTWPLSLSLSLHFATLSSDKR